MASRSPLNKQLDRTRPSKQGSTVRQQKNARTTDDAHDKSSISISFLKIARRLNPHVGIIGRPVVRPGSDSLAALLLLMRDLLNRH